MNGVGSWRCLSRLVSLILTVVVVVACSAVNRVEVDLNDFSTILEVALRYLYSDLSKSIPVLVLAEEEGIGGGEDLL